jgi:hypothetical protein
MKLSKSDYDCARSQVLPYATSSNDAIKISAAGSARVFSRLMDLTDESVAAYRTVLDTASAGSLKPGTALERIAELGASFDETWKVLVTAVIGGTYAVVEVEPTTGLMSRLALTRAQRDGVLQQLRATFGDEVTKGIKAGDTSLVVAASALYQVVGDERRQLRSK